MKTALLVSACLLVLSGCASTPSTSTPASTSSASASTARSATVNLASASGSLVSGTVMAMPMGDGVHLRGEVGGLTANSTHGIHAHEKGDCSAADASSAGDHFNQTADPHGKRGSGGTMRATGQRRRKCQRRRHGGHACHGVTLGGGAATM